MRFLVDAQLPPGLARLLSEHGHIAEHVVDIGPAGAADRDLWRYAIAHQAVIVTTDEDFSDMVIADDTGPAVVCLSSPARTPAGRNDPWDGPFRPSVAGGAARTLIRVDVPTASSLDDVGVAERGAGRLRAIDHMS